MPAFTYEDFVCACYESEDFVLYLRSWELQLYVNKYTVKFTLLIVQYLLLFCSLLLLYIFVLKLKIWDFVLLLRLGLFLNFEQKLSLLFL